MIFNCYFFKKHSIYADNRTFYKKFMIKNAFLIPISQLPYAVIIILFDIVCIGGTLYNYRTLFYGSIFWSSIGGSLLVYVNSIFMSKIFEPYR